MPCEHFSILRNVFSFENNFLEHYLEMSIAMNFSCHIMKNLFYYNLFWLVFGYRGPIIYLVHRMMLGEYCSSNDHDVQTRLLRKERFENLNIDIFL